MATSSIKIYRTHITPSRNALVDDIEEYLGSLTPVHQDDTFQYLKLGLDLNIVVNVGQYAIANHTLGNYCRIVEDGKIWYYFILNCTWKSQGAVELKLSIDSINTFRNSLTWSEKTTIARQHEDRLTRYGSTVTGQAIRVIDKQPENISAIKLLQNDAVINQSGLNLDWYLIYQTATEIDSENPNSSVECYLLANEPLIISKTGGGASQTLTPSDLPTGQYNYILAADNPDFDVTINYHYVASLQDDYRDLTFHENTWIRQLYYETVGGQVLTRSHWAQVLGMKFVSDGTYITVQLYLSAWTTTAPSGVTIVDVGNNTSTTTQSFTINSLNFTRVTYDGNIPFEYAQQLISDTMTYNIGTQVTRSTMAYSAFDKTDSKLIKIIKLPYCPTEITYSNGVYTFPNVWTYADGLMKLNDSSLSTEFENQFYDYTPISQLVYTIPSANRTVYAPRSANAESKLFNSDFYTFKYVYDSFSNEIRWENFDSVTWDEDGRPAIEFTFKPTNTINTKFDFFADYADDYYEDTQDFEGHLLVNRNNEETIFTNDYLNYLRTGYNYDKKAKEQANIMNWATTGLSLAGAIASFAASSITGGTSVAAGIALATSAIAGFANAASTQVSNERSMEGKLAGLKAQSTGVAGADDVDLMSYYSDNRMHLMRYQTETVQRASIYNLFFYCGYAHNAVAVPNLTSRYWFNYIMCKPVFKEEGVTPYNDFIDDVKARYQTGVTVYHHNHGMWDWDQEYENWEVNIAAIFDAPQLDSDLIQNMDITDADGFSCTYSADGPVTLDGTNYYLQWQWIYDVTEGGTSQGTSIAPGTSWTSGNPDSVQYEYQGATLRCRIVSTTTSYTTSEWKTITL